MHFYEFKLEKDEALGETSPSRTEAEEGEKHLSMSISYIGRLSSRPLKPPITKSER